MVKSIMKSCRNSDTCVSMKLCPIYMAKKRVLDSYFSGEGDKVVDATRDIEYGGRLRICVYSTVRAQEDGSPEVGDAYLTGLKNVREQDGGCVINAEWSGDIPRLFEDIVRARDVESRKLNPHVSHPEERSGLGDPDGFNGADVGSVPI